MDEEIMKKVDINRDWIYAFIAFLICYWAANGLFANVPYEGGGPYAGIFGLIYYGLPLIVGFIFLISRIVRIVRQFRK
jgi:hypothetical protein